ncbi:uncharacterized protein AMSG_00898 [Thecamonas trahens ATCC 50062]|uniref:BRISC and BRCA1-A complex member 1 n=1 Tax=Thecamonas trahens ATCC 50062 TaxID=461836 RepID=A0A0L0DJ21_THETB|nr:hypothetical protein AMSG_00898 [Thecamonas trahens ATCC 50062]KNC52071.1 hypothetical protein AMSG_00898 [Thecamonas trahens ATCC 50062]|eukprot:XP_013762076.1 hypothetical protein AMSG_00898 [Thecamonas trahens ATCC 50062]
MDGMEFVSKQASTTNQESYMTRLDCAKRVISNFVVAKAGLSPLHQFGLGILTETAQLHTPFTSDVQAFHNALSAVRTLGNFRSLDIGSVFALAASLGLLDDADDLAAQTPDSPDPPHVLRVILVYARSAIVPHVSPEHAALRTALLAHPHFFHDVLYLHEKPSAENDPQSVFNFLTSVEVASPESYFLEDSTNFRRLVLHTTMLVAHPLQRQPYTELVPFAPKKKRKGH